ncbi:MAG: RIP metalloprotease RseP [Oscillospiraceae bacterium]|nr:RIP metalloprotease RseP [Oscillospiraceae bacterium]
MNILITALASVLIFGLIIFIHELGHFIAAKRGGIKVNEFSLGMGPTLFSKKKGETTYSLRAFPIGGFCAMEGEDDDSEDARAFGKAPVGRRILVVVAGALMNLALGFVVIFALTVSQPALASRTVGEFYENAATEASGLQIGDTIVAVDGRRTYIFTDVQYELVRITDGTADLTVLRDGQEALLKDVQFDTAEYEDGSTGIVLDFKVFAAEKSVGNVLKYAGLWTVSIARQIFISVVDILTGRIAINQLSGPVGIVSIINQATSIGFSTVLYILAFITINLGIFNLLPLPALDGGRLIFLLVEAVTRKKLNPKYEAAINVAGFCLLMCLMVFVTYNDITKLFVR